MVNFSIQGRELVCNLSSLWSKLYWDSHGNYVVTCELNTLDLIHGSDLDLFRVIDLI